MFDEILVIDYISNYADLTDEQKKILSSKVINNQFLLNCPNGSIIGSPISPDQTSQARVYYPFFSHLRVPIKAGERAWVCSPNSAGVSYWMSRKVQNMTAEDPNFTHDDRAFTATSFSPIKNSSGFIDVNRSGRSLKSAREEALSRSQFSGRPALLAKGKSPDLIIQGSNSTSIKLTDETTGSGLIQLVAGFGPDREQRESNKLTNVTNNGAYYEFIKPPPPGIENSATLPNASIVEIAENPAVVSSRSDVISLTGRSFVQIVAGSSTVVVNSNGEVVITPGTVVKLAGNESDQPYLRYNEFNTIVNDILDILGNLQTLVTTLASIPAVPNTPPNVTLGVPDVTEGTGTSFYENIGISTADVLDKLEKIKSSVILGS